MDPNATLAYALEAIAEQEWSAAADYLADLLEWVEHGGFCPRVGAFTTQGSIDLYNKLFEMVRQQQGMR
jgi:hypothetical protein